MSINAQTLTQAREALIGAAQQKLTLLSQLKEQGRKIAELEREVQKQSTAAAHATRALEDARMEIQALRAQLPDQATINAFDALLDFLSAPAESHPQLRLAA